MVQQYRFKGKTYILSVCNDGNGNLERNQQPLQIHVIVVDRSVGANGSRPGG